MKLLISSFASFLRQQLYLSALAESFGQHFALIDDETLPFALKNLCS